MYPFVFHTELRLVALTGIGVKTLGELRHALSVVPGSSIFYHTHHQYLAHHFQKPVYYNDFALWVMEALHDEVLAEKLAALDLLDYTTVRELRDAIIATVDRHLETSPASASAVSTPDEAFHFCRSRSFVLPTDLVAADVGDFFVKLPGVTNASLYFHYFEARLRLNARTNDFSRWFEAVGRSDVAEAIDAINPYVRTLEELKQDIIAIGSRFGAT